MFVTVGPPHFTTRCLGRRPPPVSVLRCPIGWSPPGFLKWCLEILERDANFLKGLTRSSSRESKMGSSCATLFRWGYQESTQYP